MNGPSKKSEIMVFTSSSPLIRDSSNMSGYPKGPKVKISNITADAKAPMVKIVPKYVSGFCGLSDDSLNDDLLLLLSERSDLLLVNRSSDSDSDPDSFLTSVLILVVLLLLLMMMSRVSFVMHHLKPSKL